MFTSADYTYDYADVKKNVYIFLKYSLAEVHTSKHARAYK